MKIFDIVSEDVTKLNTEPKLDKLPHEEVESVINRWVNQDDHIELSNGMHVLSGENHGYEDNVALIVDQDYKIIDNDTDIVDLMQQFTAQEIDPEIVETIVEKCWKGYEKKGMKTMFGKRVPNCVKKEGKKYNAPKQPNPVAKHSRNKSGAGAHKSPKDYDRNKIKADTRKALDEGEERSIIRDAVIQQLIDTFGESPGLFADTREELIQKMYAELEGLRVEDVVDPKMEVGGQPIGNFASGRVLDVINANEVIEDALSSVNLSDMEGYVDEGTFVAQKSAIIDSILRQLKDEAQEDDELLKQLAGMVMKKADPRSHNKPQSRWQLEPIEENASKEEIQAQIKKLQPIADKLEFAKSEARDITKVIKYENTVSEIMVNLSTLADKLGIDEKELDYYERQVYEAKNKLESAVYEMEEVFEDKYKEVAYKIEELEMDLDDMEYEMRNESTEMMTEEQFDEAAGEKDACYHKVKSRYKVWPSAYASGALVQCRKKGAANWGNSKKK
jgi:hypothetical protein|tara:strand:- start:718 stop:2226 length:1509 start_codon:yes stop_codon:yes gene_type:complete